ASDHGGVLHPLPADHDDDHVRAHGHPADRARLRRRLRSPPAPGHRRRGWAGLLAAGYALRDDGDLHVPGRLAAGAGPGPRAHPGARPAPGPCGRRLKPGDLRSPVRRYERVRRIQRRADSPEDSPRLPRDRLHLSSGGVAMVVTITMITTAEKTPGSTMRSPPSVSVSPMPAKMSPTSPRGIIPIPTDSRSSPPNAPSEQACLPRTAASVRAAARPRISGLAK